jgi:hypothetical protein
MTTSSFESRVKDLCKKLLACQTELEAIELNRELRILIHERIEQIRGNLIPFPETSSGRS